MLPALSPEDIVSLQSPKVWEGVGSVLKKFLEVIFLCLCISYGAVRNQVKTMAFLLTMDTLVGKLCKAVEIKCNLAPSFPSLSTLCCHWKGEDSSVEVQGALASTFYIPLPAFPGFCRMAG